MELNDTYSYDFGLGNGVKNGNADTIGTNAGTISDTNQDGVSDVQNLLRLLVKNPKITQKQIQAELNLSLRTVKRLMSELQGNDKIVRIGNNRSGEWHLNNEIETTHV